MTASILPIPIPIPIPMGQQELQQKLNLSLNRQNHKNKKVNIVTDNPIETRFEILDIRKNDEEKINES